MCVVASLFNFIFGKLDILVDEEKVDLWSMQHSSIYFSKGSIFFKFCLRCHTCHKGLFSNSSDKTFITKTSAVLPKRIINFWYNNFVLCSYHVFVSTSFGFPQFFFCRVIVSLLLSLLKTFLLELNLSRSFNGK